MLINGMDIDREDEAPTPPSDAGTSERETCVEAITSTDYSSGFMCGKPLPCSDHSAALPGAEAGTPTLVDGYDATFWRDSYRMLANAVDLHLGDYIQGDDVAEEAIYEDAIVQAGRRLAALTSEVRAVRAEWWLHHGLLTHGSTAVLYGDDGELQCSGCGIDFKREPVEAIRMRLFTLANERFAALAAARLASPSPTGAP